MASARVRSSLDLREFGVREAFHADEVVETRTNFERRAWKLRKSTVLQGDGLRGLDS